MNKEISVQYAYKKDGKGERHGDLAERTLASEAKKHITQSISQSTVPLPFSTGTPSAPTAMANGGTSRTPGTAASSNGAFMISSPMPTPGGPYTHGVTVPQPPRAATHGQPLAPPPSGLPPRPPPSQAGYGGPQGMLPPGFSIPQAINFTGAGPPSGTSQNLQAMPHMRNR